MTRDSWGGGRGRRAPSLRAGIAADLAELERTDPAVRAAADAYDRMSAKIRAAPSSAIVSALSALLRATYLDGPPTAAQRDIWRAQAAAARDEYDRLRHTCPRPEAP